MSTNVITKSRFDNPRKHRLQVAHNALTRALMPKPNFFIERVCNVDDELIEVYFIDTLVLESGIINEDDWKVAKISYEDLLAFTTEAFRSDKNAFDVTKYQFIEDCLPMLAKAYLETGKAVLDA